MSDPLGRVMSGSEPLQDSRRGSEPLQDSRRGSESETSSTEEEEQECTNCSETVKDEDCEKCVSCENYVCGKCSLKDYPVDDWFTVDSHCSKCGQVRCRDCVYFCYDCANEGDTPNVYCKKCCPKEIQSVRCGHHCWANCEKHRKETGNQCGECDANRIYSDKYSR